MILSALLTSVGINLGLCFLFFTLYSILRKLPGNAYVYAPKLLAEGNLKRDDEFNLEDFLPSANWVRRAWKVSEDELLEKAGFDAVVLMRIFVFSLRVFIFAVVVGIFVLVPINYSGNQLSFDFIELTKKSLEAFTISNVDDGSSRMWIHFGAVYIFTIYVCFLLYLEYDYISSKRIAYFYSSKPQPHDFTILVRSIPVPSGRSVSESVESFFTEHYPSEYLTHRVIRRTSKLKGLIDTADKLNKKLVRVKTSKNIDQRYTRSGFLGLFGRRVDVVDQYEKKLESIEGDVRVERSSTAEKELPAAFVSFKTRFTTATAMNIRQGVNPTEWLTERAPAPKDVYWPFFSASFIRRWVFNLFVLAAYIILTILFVIPVVLVQGLTHLEQLERWFPFLEGILSETFVSELITGYLPSLILHMFLSFVPPIMIMLSSMQGYIALSQIEKSACIKVLVFTIWNIFFANALSGTALYRVDLIFEPRKIPEVLAVVVPGQATFFIAYVVTSGWTSTSSDLFRLKTLFFSFIQRKFLGYPDDEFDVPSVPYHSEIPRILFFGLLGVTYFFLAPMILPFLLIYYCLAYFIYRNQLLSVYAPRYETGGKFWPIVHDSTIFSLVLMHIIALGIFGLKKLPLASSLIIPLPILTIVFNSYCHRRFLPMFKEYSAETLIQKDRAEQNDPALRAFREKLVTAYQDPTLMPTRFSTNSGSQTSPLLRSSEV